MTVELSGRDLLVPAGQDLPSNTALDIGLLALGADGKAAARHTERATFTLTQHDLGTILSEGWRYLADFELPAGTHQVRVGAIEATGRRSGSAFLEIEIPDLSKGPLTSGTILLGSPSAAAMPTVGRTAVSRAVFAGPPVARREFARSETLTAFVPLYGNDPAHASGVPVVTTVRSTDARVAWRREVQHSPALEPAHTVSIPLADFTPGAYLLSVEVPQKSSTTPLARTLVFYVR